MTKFLDAAISNFLLDTDAVNSLLSLKSEYDINITNFLDSNDIADNKFYTVKFLEE